MRIKTDGMEEAGRDEWEFMHTAIPGPVHAERWLNFDTIELRQLHHSLPGGTRRRHLSCNNRRRETAQREWRGDLPDLKR